MTARMRLQPEAVGMGMTGQRVRDRLIDRLRDGAPGTAPIRDERVRTRIFSKGMTEVSPNTRQPCSLGSKESTPS